MDITESKLDLPEEFPFPFQPYDIQQDFMKNLYMTLENKKLGVFESPTGTGKSMSIICGTLKWLYDSEERKKNDLKREIMSIETELKKQTEGQDWFNAHHLQAKAKARKFELERMLSKMKVSDDRISAVIEKSKIEKKDEFGCKRKGTDKLKMRSKEVPLLEAEQKENQVSDEDDVVLNDGPIASASDDDEEEKDEVDDKYFCPKIFMCSRTHSQLTQLAGEIQKSPYGGMGVRVVALASRQNLCVNDAVLRLKHLSLINETCQDLRARKSSRATKVAKTGEKMKKLKTSCGCVFTTENNMEQLRGETLARVHDLEELVTAGRAVGACPYYTARNCVPDSQVVLVPYNTLLHRSTREASGIDLRGSVVIVDEAHNLLDTLGNIHSASVTGLQVCHAHSFLVQYRDRFQERFSPGNLLHLNQLIFVTQKLVGRVVPKTKPDELASVSRLSNFLIATEIDNLNVFTLLQFAARSRLVNKLRGYIEKFQPCVLIPEKKKPQGGVATFLKNIANKGTAPVEAPAPAPEPPVSGNPVQSLLSFLEALTNHCEDGRVVVTVGKAPADSSLKFLLLNPAAHFQDVVSQARSVVLAGGTMQPFSEFTDQLFLLTGAPASRIRTFSCGHVVPPCNILPLTVGQGPGGRVLDFSYAHRNSPELLDELGRLLVNACNVIPAGVVVFFPSYDYEDRVYRHFVEKGVIAKLEAKKKMLREPRQSNKVESILSAYAEAASKGALLFSVIGGKLSEGLNFNDDLGRCVVVVGLPYPNKTSPELKEKMAYLEENIGAGAGSIYYENLCMKAVNQSIGRSVRHAKDYAAVLLVDQRYQRPHIQAALPQWIRASLLPQTSFRPVVGLLAKFFSSKKQPAEAVHPQLGHGGKSGQINV